MLADEEESSMSNETSVESEICEPPFLFTKPPMVWYNCSSVGNQLEPEPAYCRNVRIQTKVKCCNKG